MNIEFMKKAIELASQNSEAMGKSYGAVIVKDGEIIGSGVNEVTSRQDPTAHAELLAIQVAAKKLKTTNLEGCEVYASGEPCAMCLSAIYWANIKTVYFAETATDVSAFIYNELTKPREERTITIKQI